MFGRLGGQVRSGGAVHLMPANHIAATNGDAALCNAGAGTDIQFIDFYAADFRKLFAEVDGLVEVVPKTQFQRDSFRLVPARSEVVSVLELLSLSSRSTLLCFLYVYCLSSDRTYFSRLLLSAMAGDTDFVDFIDTNALNPWSVARFADEFDMPVRKFNMLFIDKFGMPAKRWLLERRLAHARTLLVATPMRVLDIALECGFANHAHFTDSFRRRFRCNPTQYRMRAAQTADLAA
ncbi:hypothetical protein WM23_12670 [Burkholderia ubonensis]|nr:hypothetical protein WM23_12670 [Burkholderia ubonensis]